MSWLGVGFPLRCGFDVCMEHRSTSEHDNSCDEWGEACIADIDPILVCLARFSTCCDEDLSYKHKASRESCDNASNDNERNERVFFWGVVTVCNLQGVACDK